jgi:hypothetical protein
MTPTRTSIISTAIAEAIAHPDDKTERTVELLRELLDSEQVNDLVEAFSQAAGSALAQADRTPPGLEQIGCISEDPAADDQDGEWHFRYDGDTDFDGHRNIEPVFRIVDASKLADGTVIVGDHGLDLKTLVTTAAGA